MTRDQEPIPMELILDDCPWFLPGDAKLVTRAWKSVCELLAIDQVRETVHVRFSFILGFDYSAKGSTKSADWKSGDEIPVVLDALPLVKTIDTLCHEMVHVADMVTGRLKNNGGEFITYENITWPAAKIAEAQDRWGQFSLPWENKAYSRAPALSIRVGHQLGQDYVNAMTTKKEKERFALLKASIPSSIPQLMKEKVRIHDLLD
jgi:hypothetical protein